MHTTQHRTIVIFSILLFSILCSSFPGSARAADTSLTVELNSAYVYHGLTYNDGLVIQPSLDVVGSFFGFNVWANYDIGNYDGLLQSRHFSEVDLTAYVFTTLWGADLSLSLAEYTYPNVTSGDGGALPSGREIIAAAKRTIVGPLSAEIKVQYDVKEVKDYYSRLSLFYTFPQMLEDLKIELAASIAYVGEDTARLVQGGEKAGFNEYNVKTTLTYKATDNTTISANIGYTDAMDDQVLPVTDVHLYGGISIIQTL